jgi:hypothetical protein
MEKNDTKTKKIGAGLDKVFYLGWFYDEKAFQDSGLQAMPFT